MNLLLFTPAESCLLPCRPVFCFKGENRLTYRPAKGHNFINSPLFL